MRRYLGNEVPVDAELLTERRQLVHGLANSLAIVAANIESLRPFTDGAEALTMLVDIECSITSAGEQFEDLHDDRDLSLEDRVAMINRLAGAISVIALNLAALDRHVTHHREGRSIYADMVVAAARGRTQFEALRKRI